MARRKKLWVGGIAAFWLGIGVAVPLLVSFQGEEIHFDSSHVVAAPRDTFDVVEPIAIDALARSMVAGGRLGIGMPKGDELTAEETDKLLASGNAMLVLERGEIAVGQKWTGPPRDPGVDAPLVASLKSGTFKALAIRDGTIVVALPGGHVERLTQTTAQLVPSNSGAVDVKGEGFWRGQRSQFTLKSEAPDSEGRHDIAFTLEASLIDVSFDGTLVFGDHPSLSGAANVAVKGPERLVNALGRSWPIGTRIKTVTVDGPVNWEGQSLVFDKARVSVDGNKAQGTLALLTGAERGVVSGTLAFETLDIAAYLPRGAVVRDAAAWQWWNKFSASLSGKTTPPIDADLRLSATKLVSGDHTFGTAAATIALKDGKLAADIAEIVLEKGRATGQLSVDFNRFIPTIRMRGQLEGVATAPWFKALTGRAFFDGTALVKADMMAHAADPGRIASDLKGRVEITMEEGASVGIALDELKAKVTANAPEPVSEILRRALAGATRLGPVNATAVIGDGAVELRSGVISHEKGRVQLAARLDLLEKNYDVRVLALAGPFPELAKRKPALPADTVFPLDAHAEAGRDLQYIRDAQLLRVRGKSSGLTPMISLHPLSGYLRRLQSGLDLNVDIARRNGL